MVVKCWDACLAGVAMSYTHWLVKFAHSTVTLFMRHPWAYWIFISISINTILLYWLRYLFLLTLYIYVWLILLGRLLHIFDANLLLEFPFCFNRWFLFLHIGWLNIFLAHESGQIIKSWIYNILCTAYEIIFLIYLQLLSLFFLLKIGLISNNLIKGTFFMGFQLCFCCNL